MLLVGGILTRFRTENSGCLLKVLSVVAYVILMCGPLSFLESTLSVEMLKQIAFMRTVPRNLIRRNST